MVYKPLGKRRILFVFLILVFLSAASALMEKKQETAALSENSKTLVIDPGHGGIDSGALGADGTRESDINLAIALRLRAVAELYGQENTLIRQDDSSKCDTEDYSEHRDLECRTALVCAERNPVYVSIHQNHFPTAQAGGAQVIYAPGAESETLGRIMHQNIINALYPYCRRVAEPAAKKLYILSHVQCPAVLVECGFVSNPSDLENLKRPAFQTSLAVLMMASYLQYLQNTVRI